MDGPASDILGVTVRMALEEAKDKDGWGRGCGVRGRRRSCQCGRCSRSSYSYCGNAAYYASGRSVAVLPLVVPRVGIVPIIVDIVVIAPPLPRW